MKVIVGLGNPGKKYDNTILDLKPLIILQTKKA